MDAYTSFAEVYDMFMDNIPYEDWCGYLTSLLKEYGINDGLVLDLGCGTGTLTELLAKEGYDMIGVDVVSICDSLNYILDYNDLAHVFSLVNNYLDPKGMFIFDLNTEAKFQAMGSETIAEVRDEGSFIWENEYDEEEKINSYDLTLFIREEDDLYRRYQETHFERAWSLEEIKKALTEAGMEFVAAYDAFTKNAPRKESDRIYVVAREHGKEV